MTDAKITQEIIEQLADVRDPNDIILGLCEKHGMSWPEAEALVRQVQTEKQDAITLRQAPLFTAIALVTFIAGWAILALGLYPIVLVAIALLQTGGTASLLTSWEFYSVLNVTARTGLHPFVAIPLGLTMVLGSLIGMRDVWAALLPELMNGLRGSRLKG